MTAPAPANGNGSTPNGGGSFAANIMHFARVLRRAGLPIGPGRVLTALQAVSTVGLGNREDFYWALHAVFVNRRDQRDLFDQAFHIFWKNPQILERMMSLVLPTLHLPDQDNAQEISRRIAEALKVPGQGEPEEPETEEIEIDAALTWSDREVLRQMDFEMMSEDEVRRARQAIARMTLPVTDVPIRRFRPSPIAHAIDMRATMRKSLRAAGAAFTLAKRVRRRRRPPLVILCDISGSMNRYSRMLLHFLHAVCNDRDRVHVFLFGTRLTNITRQLRHRDVDYALKKAGELVEDWSGGTRIGASLHDFNVHWSRRVLGQGAVVLLITDGLDRGMEGDGADMLPREMERLHKSCRRLIWLNPLLRFEGFEPKSTGIRAMLPFVDDFRTVHNLASLEDLAAALSRRHHNREAMRTWQKQMH
ncbi:MAG: VWA domain-containing protein [Alphaproteobacteria bacterium]